MRVTERWGQGVMGLLLAAVASTGHAHDTDIAPPIDPEVWAERATLTPDARTAHDWIRANGDAVGRPFAIVDKKRAHVFVFRADGRLAGDTAALLGLAPGDQGTPGAAQRIASLTPAERTTPAGRFDTEPGHNLAGEAIVWVDYDAAISMHRVRTTNKADRRLERLASPTIADNRISYGCINVPAAFYDAYVKPALGQRRGVVYVVPESSPVAAHFDFLNPAKDARAPSPVRPAL